MTEFNNFVTFYDFSLCGINKETLWKSIPFGCVGIKEYWVHFFPQSCQNVQKTFNKMFVNEVTMLL